MATRPSEGELPIGGAGLGVDEYLEFLSKEYLADFIRRGGASVKVAVVGGDQVAERFHAGWPRRPGPRGTCSPGSTPPATGCTSSTRCSSPSPVRSTGTPSPAAPSAPPMTRPPSPCPTPAVLTDAPGQGAPGPSGDLTVASVAASYDVNPRELYRSVRRQLEQALLGGPGLAHEFRLAMLRLCQAELGAGDVDAVERDAVLGWLHGERVPLSALRSALIYGRIGRHNAPVAAGQPRRGGSRPSGAPGW